MRNKTPYIAFNYSEKIKHIFFLLLLILVALKGTTQNIFYDSAATISDNASPAQIIKQLNLFAFHFAKVPDNRINFGIVGSKYNYIILKLNSLAPYQGQYLCIDNTSIDTVSIYRIYADRTNQLLYQGGDMVSFNSTRNYVWHTVPVEISKIPSFYLIALKAPQENINVKYEIIDTNKLQTKYQSHDRVVFFYIGIVSLIIAIIILALCLFKKAAFADYLGYIVCVSTWIVSHYGYMFPYVYPNAPIINEIAKPFSTLGGGFFLILVLRLVFAQYVRVMRWLFIWINLMRYILLLLMACMFLLLIPGLHPQVKGFLIAAWHVGLLLSICIIVFIPFRFIKISSTAKIFSVAMLVICMMSMVQLFANSGFINNYFISEHGVTIGSLLEISIMAFGLIYGLFEEMKQNEIQVLALQQEQTETLKKLIVVQDNERKRIAGDLHDNIGPLLAALKINFRRIIHMSQADNDNGLIAKTELIIDDSIAEIRNVAHNLMPKGLSSNGLINTLSEYFEGIQQLYSINVQFHHNIQSILNPDLQINVYRIICELVLNAARHSNAKIISVRLKASETWLSIAIHDDGHGFLPKSADQKKSLGLQSSESRVLYLKGKFSLRTAPDNGTYIDMEIPLQFYETQVNSF